MVPPGTLKDTQIIFCPSYVSFSPNNNTISPRTCSSKLFCHPSLTNRQRRESVIVPENGLQLVLVQSRKPEDARYISNSSGHERSTKPRDKICSSKTTRKHEAECMLIRLDDRSALPDLHRQWTGKLGHSRKGMWILWYELLNDRYDMMYP
jgi:hypothetical protein